MDNPWLEWWETVSFQWTMLNSSAVRRQLAVLVGVLLVALILDRLLARHRARWLGDLPQQRKIRAVLWAIKFPVLALLLGHLALSIYSATGWPSYTLGKLVDLFWFLSVYALLAKSVVVLLPASDARQIVRRFLLPLLAVVGILHLVGLLSVLWAWASQPILTVASGTMTPASVILALAILAGSWLVAKGGKALFLQTVLPRTEADPELSGSVAGFVQLLVVIAGFWFALSSLGVEFTNLTLLLSALTIGVGFGLQDVIKNVMGGVILLSEGHVRPGEVFEIGGETGIVERIGLRSTTIRTWDRAEVIVPNSYLITENVKDLTGSQRVAINVGVSCDADPRLAERLLLEIAASHPHVLDDPAPSVFFTNLGESTFDFALYCFVGDRSQVLGTKSDLHFAVVETFRQHDLEMPYPQRDVHLRSGPWEQVAPLQVHAAK